MTDFCVPELKEATAAEQAVHYVLGRVIEDANFRYYMLHTQALELCVTAEATRLGCHPAVVESDLCDRIDQATERLKGRNAELATVVRLQQRLDRVDAIVGRLGDGLPWTEETYTKLCDAVHGIER